ncbi:MAG: YncE family protein [Bacteroidota bacterium]
MFVKVITLLVFSSILLSCKKEPPVASSQDVPLSTVGVYILNQGNFQKSNSSLSFYIPDSNKVYPDVFFAANNRALGDVGNDMVIYENKGYIVVNNSNKIEIISLDNNKSLGTIAVDGNSPYKVAILSDTKGYITNLYKGTVTSFNPTTYAIVKDGINVGSNPQGIAVANGKVYVCNSGFTATTSNEADSTVSVIDPGSDSVVATIYVAKEPTDIAVDGDGELVVACYGFTDYTNSANDTPGNITIINPKTNSVAATIPLPPAAYGHPSGLAVSTYGYGLTIVEDGVLKFDTKTMTIITDIFIGRSAYVIAVDDVTENVYIGDAKDYQQNGELYVYDKNGVEKDSAMVGIIPGTIVFKR